MFNILRDYQIVLHGGWAILHSHVHRTGVPILHIFVNSYNHQPLKKILVIVVTVKCYLLVLVCISLKTNYVKCLLLFLLTICISSLEKCLSSPLPIFRLGSCPFLRQNCLFCLLQSPGLAFQNCPFCFAHQSCFS